MAFGLDDHKSLITCQSDINQAKVAHLILG